MEKFPKYFQVNNIERKNMVVKDFECPKCGAKKIDVLLKDLSEEIKCDKCGTLMKMLISCTKSKPVIKV